MVFGSFCFLLTNSSFETSIDIYSRLIVSLTTPLSNVPIPFALNLAAADLSSRAFLKLYEHDSGPLFPETRAAETSRLC